MSFGVSGTRLNSTRCLVALSSSISTPCFSLPRDFASMATPSSSARGPSASQPPATASVTKFRCLFTHDLRRKSKRWQDGYLRYHAFNKRIMVFDEQGNFIGDHHWRSVDEVQDGDELELDKGVLIEVGERMGTTQTDLTNLFEKRKSSQGSPASRNQTPQASQSTHTSTPVRPSGSQSFRSLNDLLGIRKTPIGHLVSPYEERHPPRPSNTPERPEPVPKRQKVAAPRSPAVNNPRSQTDVVDLTGPERGSSGTNERNVGTPREHPKPQNGMSHMPPPEKPKKDTAPRSQRADPPAPKPPPPQISKPPTSRPPKVATPAPVKDPPPQQPPKHDVPSRHVPEISDDDWEAPVKTMRMTMQKPRKKLMYSALLPTEKSQKTSPGPSIPPSEKRSQSTPKTAESQ